MWKGFLRFRHGRGHGVHSPYAFRFVQDVVRDSCYGYYAENEICRHLKKEELHDYDFQDFIGFIIKLASFLKSRRLVADPSLSRAVKIAASCMNLKFVDMGKGGADYPMENDLIIVGETRDINLNMEKCVEKSVPVYAVNPDHNVSQKLEQPISRGLLLKDKHEIILIPRKEMAYVVYDMKLR